MSTEGPPRNPCFITGVGALSSLGLTAGETFDELCRGTSATACEHGVLARVPLSDGKLGRMVAPIVGRENRRLGRAEGLATLAAVEAVEDARKRGITFDGDIGVFGGSSLSGTGELEPIYREYTTTGRTRRVSRLLRGDFGLPLDRIAHVFGFGGPRVLVSNACCASTAALHVALARIQSGELAGALWIGFDPMCELGIAGFTSLGALAKHRSSPFSRGELGLALGEGAAALFLSGRADPARAYAEVVGVGLSSDGHHPTAPDPRGAGFRKAMTDAIAMSGTHLRDVFDLVMMHGTGTPLNDVAETRAVRAVLGSRAEQIKAVSIKGGTGHTLGASGAFNAVIACLAFQRGLLPPTVNFEEPRAGCDLDYNRQASHREPQAALVNSFGFGGNNGSAVLVRPSSAPPAPGPPARPAEFKTVITGIGALTPFGVGLQPLDKAIREGNTARTEHPPLRSLTGRRQGTSAGLIDLSVVDRRLKRFLRNARRMDRSSLLLGLAVAEMFENLGRRLPSSIRDRVGVCIGTGSTPVSVIEDFYRGIVANGLDQGTPGLFPNTVINAPAGYLAIDHGLRGPSFAFPQMELSGSLAIDVGARLLGGAAPNVDAVLVGGVDEWSEFSERAMLDLGHVADDDGSGVCKVPLDSRSRGYELGECGLALLMEREIDRVTDASVLGRILGTFVSAEDFPGVDRFSRSGGAVAEVVRRASASFGEPDLVVASAPGLPGLDQSLLRGVRGRLPSTPVYSPLGLFGNPRGACSILGVITALVAIRHGILPAIPGCDQPLDLAVSRIPVEAPVNTVFVVATKAGGQAVLHVVARPGKR